MPLSQSNAIQHYYGEIGIAAVAAAVRHQGDFKNAAYAPVAIEWYDRRGSDPTAFAARARDEVYCGAEALPFSVARCVVPEAINAMANKTSPFDHDAIDSAPQFYNCIGLS